MRSDDEENRKKIKNLVIYFHVYEEFENLDEIVIFKNTNEQKIHPVKESHLKWIRISYKVIKKLTCKGLT